MMIENLEMSKEEERELLVSYMLTPELFENYGLSVIDIVPKRGIYRIQTDEGFHCLKKIKYAKNDLHFIHEAMEHLIKKGFSKVARIRKTIDDRLYVADGEDVYVMTDWIDGRECDYENPIELEIAVKTLGELHQASKGFEPSSCREERNMLGKWPEIFQQRSNELMMMKEMAAKKMRKNEFDQIFLQYVDAYYDNSLEAIEGIRGFSYDRLVQQAIEEKSFCHNDYAHHNILISSDHQKVVVLDFDYCIFDLRINDIASLIQRNLKKCNWDVERARFIIENYTREYVLQGDELKGIYVYLLFPTDFWRIAHQYYIERKNWKEEAFLNKIIEKSKYRELREDFLKDFKKVTGM